MTTVERASSIRPTTVADRPPVLELVRAAFGGNGRDGQDEVDIVVATWSSGALAKAIDLVAVDDEGTILGHVLAAPGSLGADEALGVAPLAVAPSHQNRGIGSALMADLLQRAEATGWPAAVLLGAPSYYGRFGFEPSGPLGITYPPVGVDNPHFQVRRLQAYRPSLRGNFSYCWELPADA
jgi:predicted N-acetyltransferase YhbS